MLAAIMIQLTDLLWMMLLFSFLWLWWNAQGVKQIALAATRSYCQKADVQLLDDGLVLRGFWLKRDDKGRVRLWRSYDFEFSSTGEERYSGRIIMLGRTVESIRMEPYRLH